MGKKLIFLLAFAIALPAIFAQSDILGNSGICFGETINPITNYDNPLVLVGLAVCALLAIAYMVGEFYQKPELIVWSKNEMITFVWSLVLVICVFGAFFFSCNLSMNIMPQKAGATATPTQAATAYLDNLVNQYGVTIATSLVQDSIKDQFNSMPYAYWGFPWGGGGGVAYVANQRAWSAHKEVLSSAYIPLMMSINAQRMMLNVLLLGVVGLILPAGLLLRMMFITRDAGNFLIALAFSIYFFVPLTYVLAQKGTDEVIEKFSGTGANAFSNLQFANDGVVGTAYQKIGFLTTQAILIPNLMIIILVTSTMAINKGLKGLVG
ncbi:MAG: hypothetical protein WC492_00925 [Candidatus Micrarchaeia archaeon]